MEWACHTPCLLLMPRICTDWHCLLPTAVHHYSLGPSVNGPSADGPAADGPAACGAAADGPGGECPGAHGGSPLPLSS